MATATTHIADVGGYPGPARCFELDPPKNFGDTTTRWVTMCITPQLGKMSPELKVYSANESGAALGPQLQRRVGSFTLGADYDPDSEEYRAGCWWLGLQALGGYTHHEQVES